MGSYMHENKSWNWFLVQSACSSRKSGSGPSLCSKGHDVESPYYRPLQACIGGTQSRRWIPIEQRTTWPSRANLNKSELAIYGNFCVPHTVVSLMKKIKELAETVCCLNSAVSILIILVKVICIMCVLKCLFRIAPRRTCWGCWNLENGSSQLLVSSVTINILRSSKETWWWGSFTTL